MPPLAPRLRWFKDERGSTSLAVVLAIMLSLVLVAGSLQWYWTSSSSEDIQMVADAGALSAADTQSSVMQTIQLLDALLLTANLFGLLLHCVVIVAGVVTVVTEGSGAEFFEKALDLDRRYCDKRKEFARDVYRVADGLNKAAPYLVMARSAQALQKAAGQIKSFSAGSYAGLAVPFPFEGQVELTGFSDDEDELLSEVGQAHDANEQVANDAQQAQKDRDEALSDCFLRDTYKPAGTSELGWDPASAYDDFKRGFTDLAAASIPAPPALSPIDDNANTRAVLAANYTQNASAMRSALQTKVPETIGSAQPDAESYPAADLSADVLLRTWLDEPVYVLQTPAGQRRAYHHDKDCFGLAGTANAPDQVRLQTLMGASEHPPCTICSPTDWRAIVQWQQRLAPFIGQWNSEAEALRRYQRAREDLSRYEDTMQETSKSALAKVVSQAGSYLLGGRLKYQASGSRGFICVVIDTQSRQLPDFTLPPLTNAQDTRLNPQLALAGAKLMPSESQRTLPSLLTQSGDAAQANGTGGSGGGLGSATCALLGGDGLGAATSDVLSMLLALWGSCLDVYARGADGLGDSLARLPFGLDAVVKPALDQLLSAAQASPPDLRYPQPVLVDTGAVGSPDAEGFEGTFVRVLRGAKEGYEQLGSNEFIGMIRDLLAGNTDGLPGSDEIGAALTTKVLGVDIKLPLSEEAQSWLPDLRKQLDEIGAL